MNTSFFSSLKNQTVRDLYWLIFQKSPIASCPVEFNIPLFPDEIISYLEENSFNYFRQLDLFPGQLKHFVNRKKNYRLGFYAEALLSYYFQTHPEIELIIQNFQIVDNKKTIGEIDFIIKWKHRILHIELAVKYYLLIPDSDPQKAENWVGPSKKDNLRKKLLKVQDTQLNLAKNDHILAQIAEEYHEKIESFFMLRGQFFTHDQVSKSFTNTHRKLLPFFFEKDIELENKTIVKELKRPNWLGSLEGNIKQITFEEHKTVVNKPLLVQFKDGEIGFILPEDWRNQAQTA